MKSKKCLGCGRKICFSDNRDYCVVCSHLLGKPPSPVSSSVIPTFPHIDGKLNVLIIIDQYGWAFDFVARGIQKYSKHQIKILKYNRFKEVNLCDFDVLFFMNQSSFLCLQPNERQKVYAFINKCMGIRDCHSDWLLENSIQNWKIGCVSQETYRGMQRYKTKVFYCPNGVDTDIFQPSPHSIDRFIIGWAGNPNRPEKRYGLLSQLKFPLAVRTNWSPKYFIEGRKRDEMTDFYKSIDAYVCISSSEGMPQTILEAAACGLPIVSTAVGGIPDFLDKEWLVPIDAVEAVKQMNEKLEKLKTNIEYRLQVGARNLEKVLNIWSWKYVVKKYEEMFEA